MNTTTYRWQAIAVLVPAIVACSGDGEAEEAWRDYYMPEWATGTEVLPTHILSTPPATVELDPDLAPGPEGPVDVEPVEDVPDLREDAPLIVQRGESLKHYAKWSGHSVDELMTMMDLSSRRITAGKHLKVSFSPSTWKRFQRQRQAFRQDKETGFFAKNHVEDLVPYKVKKGDSVWKIANKNGGVPLWVLEKFNSRVDLAKLRPGMELLIPKLVPLGSDGKSPSEALWKAENPKKKGTTSRLASKRLAKPSPRQLQAAPTALESELALESEGIDESLSGMSVRVRDGETLQLYARWAGCLVREIRLANPGMRGRLRRGQTVFIPMAENKTTGFLRKRNKHIQSMEAADVVEEVPPTRPTPQYKTYAVERGDTAWKIASRHKLSLDQLRQANRSKNLSRLRAGDKLRIPSP